MVRDILTFIHDSVLRTIAVLLLGSAFVPVYAQAPQAASAPVLRFPQASDATHESPWI